MSEMNRVQRWRQQQREAGKDALTIWLPRELKLYVEDIALKRHCSPSDLIQQALTTCYPLGGYVTDTVTDTCVTDTSQIRLILRQELRAFLGERPSPQGVEPAQPATDTVTDTIAHAETVAAAPPETWNVTDTVTVTDTDTVADTHIQAQDVTAAALETPLATDAVTDAEPVTDTVTVTGHAGEPFDTTKYRLGKLCPRGHDYHGTGQSLRKKNKAGGCLTCDAENARARRQAKRQEVSA